MQDANDRDFIPNMQPMKIDHKKIALAMQQAKTQGKWCLAFVLGTKPCFYKFFGAIQAAHDSLQPYIVINANQHYDPNLTAGIGEFNLTDKIAVNLEIRGDLAQKSAELFLKCGWLAKRLRRDWPQVNVVPVVLGDTLLAGIVPTAWLFSVRNKSINIEAGLRSMSPGSMKKLKNIDAEKFIADQQHGEWELIRNEPFPEQLDTYISSAACEYHFAPVDLNKQNLVREGYLGKNIYVIGNPVMDALRLKLGKKPKQSIFSIYPQLEIGSWIRIDIHRRENLTPRRLKSIVGAAKQLVQTGHKVIFIQMPATRDAFKSYGMQNVFDTMKSSKDFLFTDLWPQYEHVVEFYNSEHCLAALTDSGGLQEDMNTIRKLCMTCRFSTDRPETVRIAKGNYLVPPYSVSAITDLVDYITSNNEIMKHARKQKPLYGKNVGRKFLSIVNKLQSTGASTFTWTHEALGLWREDNEGVRYL